MYNPKSGIAQEFISDDEIIRTIEYARSNKDDIALAHSVIDKAREMKGITHREAALLLECEDEGVIARIFELAKRIKDEIYGKRVVMFAPLYLSNYCVNGCTYCPYHYGNKHMNRKKTFAGRNRGGSPRSAGYGP